VPDSSPKAWLRDRAGLVVAVLLVGAYVVFDRTTSVTGGSVSYVLGLAVVVIAVGAWVSLDG